MSAAPRLVLDTNVVLDMLHFADPGLQPLVQGIENGSLQALACAQTLAELARVLDYPAFRLTPDRAAAIYGRYAGCVCCCEIPEGPFDLPRCSDRDDQVFLQLAAHGQASYLVSRDKAVLRLKRRVGGLFCILSPAQFLAIPANDWRENAPACRRLLPK
jgi:putative PIN family toxin of toxin-antitoxin system